MCVSVHSERQAGREQNGRVEMGRKRGRKRGKKFRTWICSMHDSKQNRTKVERVRTKQKWKEGVDSARKGRNMPGMVRFSKCHPTLGCP